MNFKTLTLTLRQIQFKMGRRGSTVWLWARAYKQGPELSANYAVFEKKHFFRSQL